jgi:hypothetical protein
VNGNEASQLSTLALGSAARTDHVVPPGTGTAGTAPKPAAKPARTDVDAEITIIEQGSQPPQSTPPLATHTASATQIIDPPQRDVGHGKSNRPLTGNNERVAVGPHASHGGDAVSKSIITGGGGVMSRKRKGTEMGSGGGGGSIDDCGQVKKIKVDKTGQSKLSSFFAKPREAGTAAGAGAAGASSGSSNGTTGQERKRKGASKRAISEEDSIMDEEDAEIAEVRRPEAIDQSMDPSSLDAQFERDMELALMLSQSETSISGAAGSSSPPSTDTHNSNHDSQQQLPASKTDSRGAWTNLLAPLQAPNCIVHGEPTKLLTVNKPGPNKGKTFYVCSR